MRIQHKRPTYSELVFEQLQDTKTKVKDTRKELIDAMHNEIKSSTNHGQIATGSTVGIALGVLYSLIFR